MREKPRRNVIDRCEAARYEGNERRFNVPGTY
jgi:hypothetical protein